jgi:acetyl-CoA C-acetyltransferase
MYEELGLCEPGGGGRLIDDGVVEKEGILPVNPSGGRVAAGHVGGVSGLYSAACVVRQLREQAGDMQVPIRTGRGLVQANDGLSGLCGISILERR